MLNTGEKTEAALVVTESDTAGALALSAADEFPAVLATSRMIALMEVAAARAMTPLLAAGQLSVGVAVDIRHLAATPVGAEVHAVATFLGMEGKLFAFRLEAFDPGGKIGEGRHTRAIIDSARLIAGAADRVAGRAAK